MLKKLLITIGVLLVLAATGVGIFVWRRPLTVFVWMNRRALLSAGMKKTSVPSAIGAQVVFEGGAGPTLVLLHGAGDQAGTWSKVVPQLLGHYHVVAVDLPGHGESKPAAGPLTMAAMLTGTETVLARYSPPVTVVGNSMGAWIAMLYAQRHPERVLRVVNVDGGPLRGDQPALAKLPANREEARRLYEAVLDPGNPRIPDFVIDDVVREANRGPMARMMAARDATGGPEMQAFLLDNLSGFPVPVDLLWGESDQLVPLRYARAMEAQLPAVRLTTVPRCGHLPQQECPITFGRALQSVLQQPVPQAKASTSSGAAK